MGQTAVSNQQQPSTGLEIDAPNEINSTWGRRFCLVWRTMTCIPSVHPKFRRTSAAANRSRGRTRLGPEVNSRIRLVRRGKQSHNRALTIRSPGSHLIDVYSVSVYLGTPPARVMRPYGFGRSPYRPNDKTTTSLPRALIQASSVFCLPRGRDRKNRYPAVMRPSPARSRGGIQPEA